MDRSLLIVAVIVVIAALVWAWISKPKLVAPQEITIRGTVIEPVDVGASGPILLQNYEDLTEWTIDRLGMATTSVEIGFSRTISVTGEKTGQRSLKATSITEVAIPNISVEKPVPNEVVPFPLIIEGKGRAFENTINLRVKNADGSGLAETFAMVDAPSMGLFGRYHVELTYPTPKSDSGTLEVFEASAKDGEPINMVTVSIRFPSVEISEVKVFFANRFEDPDMMDCTKVYPVTRRIQKTTAVAQAALTELLRGTTPTEGLQGYFTSIPNGTKLNSVTIENGTARADFSAELDQNIGGSCRVASISSQIRNTLLQFPTVKKVVISRNGSTEDILQP